MNNVNIEPYCGSTINAIKVRLGFMKIWFSYDTPVAFSHALYKQGITFIRENDWSTTTGKHINSINKDKSRRISGEEFDIHFINAMKLGVINYDA